MVMVDILVNACIEQYQKLPKTGKPSANEWTVISAILGVFNSTDVKVLSLGTGSKCIGKSLMSSKGDILNDSHAEVIARRAFLKYLYSQIIQYNTINFSEVFYKDDENYFHVKDSVKFYFVTGMSPCGDASIIMRTGSHLEDIDTVGLCVKNIQAEMTSNLINAGESTEEPSPKRVKFEKEKLIEPDIHRTGAKCLTYSTIQDPHLPGHLYHSIGAVRTKPGRGDPTLSLSCSDKIARWNAVGWQGALLSLFVKNPIFVEAIICGGNCPFSKTSFDRAVNERVRQDNFIPIFQSNVTFPNIKTVGKKPNPSSIIWCSSNGMETEVSVHGRKLGVTKKNINKKIARTSICKKELFLLFEKAVNSLDQKTEFLHNVLGDRDKSLTDVFYGELKSKAFWYQSKWKIVKENYFKVWSDKTADLLKFTLKECDD